MSISERDFIGAFIFGGLFVFWTWLVFDLGSYNSVKLHSTQETCEAELLRSESCEQVWVKG